MPSVRADPPFKRRKKAVISKNHVHLRAPDPVVAICLSDVHLSLRPPIAREGERSWLKAMERVWKEIEALSATHDHPPILCAGDLFDRWNSPVELVNWALEHLPHLYAIPGNHDLPMHQVELIKRSAYWTLVRAGKVTDVLTPRLLEKKAHSPPVLVYARPFGDDVKPPLETKGLHILLTHEYVWVKGKTYPGALDDHRLGRRARSFSRFDVVVVGDNHQGFIRKLKSGTRVINCGTLLRRKSNEVHYRPQVGLIHASGRVVSHKLDISRDVITEIDRSETTPTDDPLLTDFIEELSNSQSESLNFTDAMKQALAKTRAPDEVRSIILEILE